MGLRELCGPYEDENGVMLDRNAILDGNALLYTGAKIVLLEDEEGTGVADFETFEKALAKAQIVPGLIERYGKPHDWQAHDDYVGMLAASAIIDNGQFARDVLAWGRKHKYCWNSEYPLRWTLKGFFVRQPGFWATAKAAADEWLNPFDQLMAVVDLLYILVKEDGASGTLMDYLQYKTYVRNCAWWDHPILRMGCVLFKAVYLKKHPRGIKESYIEYYGPSYPFSQLPEGKF